MQSSAKYKALSTRQKRGVDALANAPTVTLTRITPGLSPTQKAGLVTAYKAGTGALTAQGWLTTAQATTLKVFANAL